jgi:hypothetical protein
MGIKPIRNLTDVAAVYKYQATKNPMRGLILCQKLGSLGIAYILIRSDYRTAGITLITASAGREL